MSTITKVELTTLPFITIERFNPDYDDDAEFSLNLPDGQKFPVVVAFDEELRHYRIAQGTPADMRYAIVQIVDILLNECFAHPDECVINEDCEDTSTLWFDTLTTSLYTSSGREVTE